MLPLGILEQGYSFTEAVGMESLHGRYMFPLNCVSDLPLERASSLILLILWGRWLSGRVDVLL